MTLSNLFHVADNAKNVGRYDIANAVFAYLLAAHRTSRELKVQYEFAWHEGNPQPSKIANVTTDAIEWYQYNALIVLYTATAPDQPTTFVVPHRC